ncbi:hypothetical protein MSAN_02231800 [Mycena sanguinolenta]|uniref:MYND-type domain-containing protein n=1 Tax=Mycena sanguinolenta TaxID=230812 RepID=A0A8H7CHH0_9AGAR|nr:hypothetical protein MSAN_02231800 [Mycena sanguinolenta]
MDWDTDDRSLPWTHSRPSPAKLYEGYSILHVAIDLTDPPFACEMLRHGTPIDQKNGRGQTPLLHALQRLRELCAIHEVSETSRPSLQELRYKTQIRNAIRRVHYIVRILLDQHADVNSTGTWKGGKVISSLHFACAMGDWDLLALLLEHGAKSRPTPACADAEEFLAVAADQIRFRCLKANPRSSRPLRLCLCFSGKPLVDCHSQEQPYPEDFICTCGSAKAYGKCCKGRNTELNEKWNEKTRTIQHSRRPVIGYGPPAFASPETQAVIKEVLKEGDKDKTRKMVEKLIYNSDVRSVYAECLDIGFQDVNRTDPAFRFAYFETKFFPSPQGRSSSKHYCRQKQKDWNAAVDGYIAGGTDNRPRFAIEAAAKVGISLGALHRTCEADGCDKVEGRDIEKVATCSRCKMTFYCGPICQKAHWPTHKAICGTPEQTERPLSSQAALIDFVCKYSTTLMQYRLGSEFCEKLLETD